MPSRLARKQWRQRRVEAGCCRTCGKPRERLDIKSCDTCAEKQGYGRQPSTLPWPECLARERQSQVAKFLALIDVTGACHVWRGPLDPSGYGRSGGRWAHQRAYELANGHKVPAGLEIDHTCANRRCVNPAHLEAVTHAENVRRYFTNHYRPKEFCRNGHLKTADNFDSAGIRRCRICRSEGMAAAWRRARALCEAHGVPATWENARALRRRS